MAKEKEYTDLLDNYHLLSQLKKKIKFGTRKRKCSEVVFFIFPNVWFCLFV